MKMQPRNGLIIQSFYNDMRDKELVRTIPLLVFLSQVEDVRTVRDWQKSFQKESSIYYTDNHGVSRVLRREKFLSFIIDKLFQNQLRQVFREKSTEKEQQEQKKKPQNSETINIDVPSLNHSLENESQEENVYM